MWGPRDTRTIQTVSEEELKCVSGFKFINRRGAMIVRLRYGKGATKKSSQEVIERRMMVQDDCQKVLKGKTQRASSFIASVQLMGPGAIFSCFWDVVCSMLCDSFS